MLAKRAYKFRFYPDPQQETLLAQTFGCVRYVYNSILRYRTDAYYQANEKVSYLDANARLTAIKKLPELLFLNDVSSVPLFVKANMSLDVRSWECPECGATHDRDVNAARNILAAGLAVLAFGENVSGDGISVSLSCSR
jgi:transposase